MAARCRPGRGDLLVQPIGKWNMAWKLTLTVSDEEPHVIISPFMELSVHDGTLCIEIGTSGLAFDRIVMIAAGRWISVIIDHVPDGEN